MKNAFTIIELIFVVVILGILSAVALPKFGTIRNQADISKGRADVASIRSSILSERQSRIIRGDRTFIPKLSSNATTLFTGDTVAGRKLLSYGIVAGTVAGKWSAADATYMVYNFKVDDKDVKFTYTSGDGAFTCARGGTNGDICKKLID